MVRRLTAGGLAIALLLPISAAAGKSAWKLRVDRASVRFQSIHALYGNFWAVGEKGALLFSLDGKMWDRRQPFTDKNLYSSSFPEPDVGCVVGEGGLIAITDDNGAEWHVRKTGVTSDLRSVSFGNRNVGCAVGVRGVLMMTYDGGESWVRRDVGHGESLFAVVMVSPHEAWAVGERGIMLHTADAGRNWRMERDPSGQWMYAVDFKGGTGWAVGRRGFVLRHMLNKWERIPLPAAAGDLYGVAAISGESAYLVGEGGQMWATGDAGMSWKKRRSQTDADLTGVAITGDIGWAVGAENAVHSTIDGGKSWATYSLENLPSFMAAAFTDASSGWVVGELGLIWHTRDGGRSWGQQDSGIRGDVKALSAVSRRLCFAAGEATIVKTDNGGSRWRRVWMAPPISREELEKPKSERTPPVMFNDIFFFDARRGWAVGTAGTMLYTGSEGERWERLPWEGGASLNAVWFLSPSRGFVAGGDGRIYATKDRGNSWEPKVVGGGGEALRSIFFLDTENGWAVGDGGTIVMTSDGGETWKETRLGGAISLRDIWYVDLKRGWLAGERGTLLHTWNGGTTWVNENPPVQANYFGLWFVNQETGWAVGDRGAILVRSGSGG